MTFHVRSASLINYVNLAQEAGLDPLAMVIEAGLPVDALDNPDMKIPGVRVRALLEASARRSGWRDFGLRLAETRQFWVLGPLALAVREQATLRPALAVLIRHIRLHNEAIHLWLEEDDHAVALHMDSPAAGMPRQALELSMGTMVRFFKRALPQGWQPLRVCLTHNAPADLQVAHRVLGRRLEYGALFNGIVFSHQDMDLPMVTHTRLDEDTRRYVHSIITGSSQSVTAQVRQLALALLPSGQCSLASIAQHMGVDPRTIDRRLSREGASYGNVLHEIRMGLVRQLMESPARKQVEVASLLGFSGPAVFSRWFRKEFGCTPGEWRNSNQGGSAKRSSASTS